MTGDERARGLLAASRGELYWCPGRMHILAELSLERSTGAVYDPINCGDAQVAGLRRALAGLSLSAWPDGGPAGRGCEKLAAA